MAAEIIIQAGGDHRFDLDHLRREGAADLLQRVLQLAGHHQGQWHLRVEKKVNCGSETQPIFVLNSKPWCCYVKIKPGDNNSAHYCSLLMPPGLVGDELYEGLKCAAARFGRDWRNGPHELPIPAVDVTGPVREVAPISETAPAMGPPEDQEMDTPTDLTNWIKDQDKTRLTLLAIHQVGQAGPPRSKKAFVAALADKLGWRGVTGHARGGIFRSLVRHHYITETKRRTMKVGYVLTDKGKQLIGDLLGPEVLGPRLQASVPEAAPEPAGTLPAAAPAPWADELAEVSQQLAEVSGRLQANRARRAELMAEIQGLDVEAAEIGKPMCNPEVQALMQRLRQAIKDPRSQPR